MPFRKTRQSPLEISTDIPEVYQHLFVNWYSAYLNRIKWAAITTTLAFLELIFSGFLFRDPATGSPPPLLTYINIIAFVAILVSGGAWFWGYEHKKHNEVAGKHFARVNLRVRPNFKAYFHAPHRPVVKLVKDEWEEIHRALGRSIPEKSVLDALADKSELNWFFFRFEDFILKGLVYGSRAKEPDVLYHLSQGEVIWKGYPRSAGNVEDYDMSVLGEWRLRMPDSKDVEIIPICMAAGDYYQFLEPYEAVMNPVQVSPATLGAAQRVIDASVAQEVLLRMKTLEQQQEAINKNQFTLEDLSGRMTEKLLSLFDIMNTPERQRTARLSRRQLLAIALSVTAVAIAVWFLR